MRRYPPSRAVRRLRRANARREAQREKRANFQPVVQLVNDQPVIPEVNFGPREEEPAAPQLDDEELPEQELPYIQPLHLRDVATQTDDMLLDALIEERARDLIVRTGRETISIPRAFDIDPDDWEEDLARSVRILTQRYQAEAASRDRVETVIIPLSQVRQEAVYEESEADEVDEVDSNETEDEGNETDEVMEGVDALELYAPDTDEDLL
jgi:hypothetical protein